MRRMQNWRKQYGEGKVDLRLFEGQDYEHLPVSS